VFCGGGIAIPNQARQAIVEEWCAADREMLDVALMSM